MSSSTHCSLQSIPLVSSSPTPSPNLSVDNSTSGEHSVPSQSAIDSSAIPIDRSVSAEIHNSDSSLPSNGGTTGGNGDTSVETTGHSADISIPNVSNAASTSIEHSEYTTLAHSSLPTTSTNTHPMRTRSKSGIVQPKINPTLLLTHCEPKSVKHAISDPNWLQAMQQEYSALINNNTWDLVPLPSGRKAIIDCKWVFRVKENSDGSLQQL